MVGPRPSAGDEASTDERGAPYFEDLAVGYVEHSAPAVTLTDGMAALHRAIVGDRLPLALDAELARRVVGAKAPLAHPALVWDVAIGQSTVLTGRVIANLFYRGLALKRFPVIGDTLASTTEVVGLRRTSARPGRPPSGLALLRIRTTDQRRRAVLDFTRCAMLPPRRGDSADGCGDHGDGDSVTSGVSGSFDELPSELDPDALRAPVWSWQLDALPRVPKRSAPLGPGWQVMTESGDVVSSAPELARLTLNVAAVHHDRHRQPSGERLVYGGHTIGLAASQACRALPELVTILGWNSCEHTAPVTEGDTLYTGLELERLEALPGRGRLAHLRARVNARRGGDPPQHVLDWRFVALLAG